MLGGDVLFHRLAAAEFQGARRWYEQRSPQAAERFRKAIAPAVTNIAAGCERHPIIARDYRRVRVASFPFVLIFYRRTSGDVMIIAVAHTSRRPGYWNRRR